MTHDLDELRAHREEIARGLGVCPDIHADDFIFRFLLDHPRFPSTRGAVSYYFNDGAKSARALRELVTGVCEMGEEPIEMLEFASGFGCVTRHLPVIAPAWRTTACDIHPEAVRFLQEGLKADALLSTRVPEALSLDRDYDVVFALSFFSHMPKHTFARWLGKLASLVRPGGHLIFTAHGAVSHARIVTHVPVDAEGFGFEPESEQKDLDVADYGTTISYAPFVLREALALDGFRLRYFHEGFWWRHQDVYILRRPP